MPHPAQALKGTPEGVLYSGLGVPALTPSGATLKSTVLWVPRGQKTYPGFPPLEELQRTQEESGSICLGKENQDCAKSQNLSIRVKYGP